MCEADSLILQYTLIFQSVEQKHVNYSFFKSSLKLVYRNFDIYAIQHS